MMRNTSLDATVAQSSTTSRTESEGRSDDDDYLSMSDDLSDHIYEHRIAPENLVKEGVAGRPQFWIVGGENGVGKTTAMDNILSQLGGPAQKICADDLVKYVPGYHELAAKNPALAQDEASDFTIDWCDRLQNDAAEKAAHILVETSLPLTLQKDVDFAEHWGYDTGLYLIVEPKEISWTAVVDRTDKALKTGHIGTSPIVSDNGHSQRYAAWPRAVFDAERTMQFDQIVIARRDGTLMYRNRRQGSYGDKRWVHKPQGLDVVLLERHRGFGPAQVTALNKKWEILADSPHLAADRFLRNIQLNKHKGNILARVNSDGNRFDPFTDRAVLNPRGAAEWRKHLVDDLELIKTSRNNMGLSPQFDQHLDYYAAALIDQAYRPASAIRRLGTVSSPSLTPEPHTLGTPFAHGLKRPFEKDANPTTTKEAQENEGHVKRPKLDARGRMDPVR